MGFNAQEMYASNSNWLKAEDLKQQEHTLLIENVSIATIKDQKTGQDQQKLELHFRGAEKMLLLNKTNADAISYAYTPDTDQWIGKHVVLYPTMVSFGNQTVPAIRVRPVLPQALQQSVAQTAQAPSYDGNNPPADAYDDLDDDIPF